MRFDYTKGMTPKYMVSIHRWNGSDYNYFHYFREALDLFEKLKTRIHDDQTTIRLYDLDRDIVKRTYQFKTCAE